MSSLNRPFEPIASRAVHFPQVPGGASLVICAEERIAPEAYDWNGSERERNRPVVLFQYTMSGCGRFRQSGREQEMTPGRAFIVELPSDHRYWLPQDGGHWSFLWLMSSHPFMVERLLRLAQRHNGVVDLPQSNASIAQLLRLLDQSTLEPYSTEADMLRIAIELERSQEVKNGDDPFLEEVRSQVLQRLGTAFGVSELAQWCGMSRTHFSHRFREASGIPPSDFIRTLRLEAAMEQLRDRRQPLKAIAAATGFADANHLCKAFRRRFLMTPGEYRKTLPTPVLAPVP